MKDMQSSNLERVEFRQKLYRRRYLLPNAVTVGNLFCGFLAVVYASLGRFQAAAVVIGIAILLDGLDGRVARRLNATSKFGVEFDSFSDLISFGVAPGFLLYFWCFRAQADEFGVLFCFLFLLSAATRLARFNISESSTNAFQGLPTPGAAGLVAALVNFSPVAQTETYMVAFGGVVAVGLGALMVSHLPFFSIKKLKIKDVYAPASLIVGLLIAISWYNSKVTFVVLAIAYTMSGPVLWVTGKIKRATQKPTKVKPSS